MHVGCSAEWKIRIKNSSLNSELCSSVTPGLGEKVRMVINLCRMINTAVHQHTAGPWGFPLALWKHHRNVFAECFCYLPCRRWCVMGNIPTSLLRRWCPFSLRRNREAQLFEGSARRSKNLHTSGTVKCCTSRTGACIDVCIWTRSIIHNLVLYACSSEVTMPVK